MVLPGLSRTLTVRGRLALTAALGVVAIVIVLVVMNAIGFRFDPFDLAERRADRAEASAATAAGDAAARKLEVAGERATAQRVEVVVRQSAAAAHATYSLSAQAWSADDASLPLPPDRADRLRAHDRELCRLRQTLAGCPAAAADAAGGRRAVPDLPSAGAADPG